MVCPSLLWASFDTSLCRVRGPHGLLFRIVDGDGVIEARDLEDAPVVVAEAVGQQLLLFAVDADEQRNQETDAATVHILEVLEVQDDRTYLPIAGLVVGVHQHVLGERGELPLHVYDAGLLACAPDVHLDLGFGHFYPPCPVHLPRSLVLAAQALERAARRFVPPPQDTEAPVTALSSSGKTLIKSERRVMLN